MDTEFELELQALEAIFMNDLQCSPSRKSFKLRVVPSFGGAFKNHLAVELSASFPDDYPSTPLQEIELKVLEGNMLDDSLWHLKNLVIEESSKLVGTPMAFSVIESLKEHLELYNEDLNEGTFVLLSNEIIVNIMSYLPPHDLASLACVNKKIKTLSEDENLWRDVCEREPKLKDKIKRLKNTDDFSWKNTYIDLLSLSIPELDYVVSIVERKNTGDEWLTHLEHVTSWKLCFKKEMQNLHSLNFTGESNGKILSSNNQLLGHYRFVEEMDAPWKDEYAKHTKLCPYVGNILGYVRFYLKHSVLKTLRAFISVCRGTLARYEQYRLAEITCLKKESVRIVNFVDQGRNTNVFEELGFIVDPRKTRKRSKYLNEIVDLVNASLIPLKRSRVDMRRVVEYNSGQSLYPFEIQAALLAPNWKDHIGIPGISFWAFNLAQLPLIAGKDALL